MSLAPYFEAAPLTSPTNPSGDPCQMSNPHMQLKRRRDPLPRCFLGSLFRATFVLFYIPACHCHRGGKIDSEYLFVSFDGQMATTTAAAGLSAQMPLRD